MTAPHSHACWDWQCSVLLTFAINYQGDEMADKPRGEPDNSSCSPTHPPTHPLTHSCSPLVPIPTLPSILLSPFSRITVFIH